MTIDSVEHDEWRTRVPPFSAEFLDTYSIVRPLGEGGMGAVYLAHQESLDRDVALKVLKHLSGDDEARFVREGRILATMSCPNIIAVFDAGMDGSIPYLVCELVVGETLLERITRERLTLRSALELSGGVAAALTYAHARGVLHRDVKPGNVFVTREDAVKLGDFGLAREEAGGGTLTAAGTIMGTPSYMAPEQVQGQRAGPAADQYALGVMTFELVSGSLPFVARSPMEIAMKRLEVEPPSLALRCPGLPSGVTALVSRALSRDPVDRWPSVAAFGDEVSRILERLGPAGDRAYRPVARVTSKSARQVEDTETLGPPGQGSARGIAEPGATVTPGALGPASKAPAATRASTARRAGSTTSVPAAAVAPVPAVTVPGRWPALAAAGAGAAVAVVLGLWSAVRPVPVSQVPVAREVRSPAAPEPRRPPGPVAEFATIRDLVASVARFDPVSDFEGMRGSPPRTPAQTLRMIRETYLTVSERLQNLAGALLDMTPSQFAVRDKRTVYDAVARLRLFNALCRAHNAQDQQLDIRGMLGHTFASDCAWTDLVDLEEPAACGEMKTLDLAKLDPKTASQALFAVTVDPTARLGERACLIALGDLGDQDAIWIHISGGAPGPHDEWKLLITSADRVKGGHEGDRPQVFYHALDPAILRPNVDIGWSHVRLARDPLIKSTSVKGIGIGEICLYRRIPGPERPGVHRPLDGQWTWQTDARTTGELVVLGATLPGDRVKGHLVESSGDARDEIDGLCTRDRLSFVRRKKASGGTQWQMWSGHLTEPGGELQVEGYVLGLGRGKFTARRSAR
jgi:serine/threonine-protein kinase